MEREKPKRSAFHRWVVKCFLGHDDPAGDLAYDMARDDFFPEEKLDSTMAGKSQESVSKFMFEKSKEYATRIYNEHKDLIHSGKVNYMFLEIDKATRAYVQPIAAK